MFRINTPHTRGRGSHKAKFLRDSKVGRIHLNPTTKRIGEVLRFKIVCFEKFLGFCYIITDLFGCEAVKNWMCMRVVTNRSDRVFGDVGYIFPAKCECVVCAGVIGNTKFLANR